MPYSSSGRRWFVDYEELLAKAKNEPAFKEKVDLLKNEVGFLGDLYLILINENGSVWGFRLKDPQCLADTQFIQSLKSNLGIFLKNFFHLETDPEVRLADSALREVNEVLASSNLLDYVASHGGELAIVDVNEKEGKIFVSMSGSCSGCPASLLTMKFGIRSVLKKFLPWVQSIQSVDDPEEPDFGIKDALEEAQKELQEKEGREK